MKLKKLNLIFFIFSTYSANLNQRKLRLHQALFKAVETDNMDLLRKVLEYRNDINLNIKDLSNNTPLLLACQKNHFMPALHLISTGSDINCYNISSGNTALIEAVKSNCSSVVYKLLRQPNIELNVCNNCGDTALHIAVENNHQVIISMLLEKDIDTSIKNVRGYTALDLATILKNRDVQLMIINSRWKKRQAE